MAARLTMAPRERPRTSLAWAHFEIKDSEKGIATCNHCLDSFSYKTSVSNLMKHLKAKHSYVVKSPEDTDEDETDAEEKGNDNTQTSKPDGWEYFTFKGDDLKLACCSICDEEVSYDNNGNLLEHLLTKHEMDIKVSDDENIEYNDEEVETENTYIEGRARAKSSIAWEYFHIKDEKRRVAVCNLCGASRSYRTSVSNLMKHVRRKHNVNTRRADGDDGGETTDAENNIQLPAVMRAHRSVVWLYFKCLDPESKMSQCLICKKMLSHSTTLTNLKKHLARKHPNLKIPGREDGSKRILLASGGELYEVQTAKTEDVNDDNQNDTMEMDTVYLEDFDALDQEPAPKKRKYTKSAPKRIAALGNSYDTSSEEEVAFSKKYVRKPNDPLDHFGRYVASLLRLLPRDISSRLQADFVQQLMSAQLECEQNAQVTDTKGNAYSITITSDPSKSNDVDESTEILSNIVEEVEDK